MRAPSPRDPFAIDLEACRSRQRRLLEVMARQRLDLIVVTQIEHVQWLAGPRFAWTFSPAAALTSDGRLTLVAPARYTGPAAADDVLPYEAQWHSTLRNDQRQASSAVLLKALGDRSESRRVGAEFSSFPPWLGTSFSGELIDIEPELYHLRRRKHADELARLRQAIAATGSMYAKAREIVRPGINELDVFNDLQSVAVRELGEMLSGTGNDYASGARGGPPRDRRIEAGELYILDLGPAFRGYFADNCRVLAVGGQPTEAQERARQKVEQVFDIVTRYVKPGASCRGLFQEVQRFLDEARPWVFDHHLGHGIGLFPHEGPHLNPHWDDTFEEGDVFTCEPGLYGPELRAGVRLENDYLVTSAGAELLSDFPLHF